MGAVGGAKPRDTKTFANAYASGSLAVKVHDHLIFAIDAIDQKSYTPGASYWKDVVTEATGTLGGGAGGSPVWQTQGWFKFEGAANAGSGDDVRYKAVPAFNQDPWTVAIWYRAHFFADWQTWLSTPRSGAGFNMGTDSDGDFVYFVSPSRRSTSDGLLDPNDDGQGKNIWRHLVMTRQSGTGGTIKNYMDGVHVSTGFDNQANLTKTTAYIGNLDGNSEYAAGDIPLLSIYDFEMTASDVSSLFENQRSRFGV